MTEERDFAKRPYSADERRVVDYFNGAGIGGGEDPIGYLLTAHQYVMRVLIPELREEIKTARADADRKAREECLAIAEYGIKWTPPLTPSHDKLSREVTASIARAIRGTIKS